MVENSHMLPFLHWLIVGYSLPFSFNSERLFSLLSSKCTVPLLPYVHTCTYGFTYMYITCHVWGIVATTSNRHWKVDYWGYSAIRFLDVLAVWHMYGSMYMLTCTNMRATFVWIYLPNLPKGNIFQGPYCRWHKGWNFLSQLVKEHTFFATVIPTGLMEMFRACCMSLQEVC